MVSIQRQKRGYLLVSTLRVPRPIEQVFEFFADARGLDQLTPAYLRFEILTPDPIAVGPGVLLDYRLRIHGLPVRWQSEITVWDPPHRFVDEQRKGPYRWWIHEHRFVPKHGDTDVVDRVHYGVPGGALTHGLFIARDLRAIFEYRAARLRRLFGSAAGPDAD